MKWSVFSLSYNTYLVNKVVQTSRAGQLPFFNMGRGGEQCLPRVPDEVPTSKLVKVRFYLEHGPPHQGKCYVSASFLDVTLL